MSESRRFPSRRVRRIRHARPLAVLSALLAVGLSGCAAEPQRSPTAEECREIIRQVTYETAASAARAGHAADPVRLAETMPSALDGERVLLPAYEDLVGWDDGRELTLLEALYSTSIGVAAAFDFEAAGDSLNRSGPCAGWKNPSAD